VPEPGPGQVLVRNTYLSVDPYMRGRMNDVKSYVPPFQVGQVLDGGAMGEVIASGSEQVPVGATVVHNFGWRELALFDAKYAQVVDPSATPEPGHLSRRARYPGTHCLRRAVRHRQHA